MPKNIVVLSDGTGQVGGIGHDTNVYKLFRMLEDRTDNQVVFYDEGVGVDGDRLAGLAFGSGFDTNILQCYRFLFEHYQSGDRLFFFGFSRGAATVRSLASFIHYFGILPMSRPELIAQAYQIYKNRRLPKRSEAEVQEPEEGQTIKEKLAHRTFKAIDKAVYGLNQILRDDLDVTSAEFVRKHPNQWATIEFLGVWDTVPALGLVPIPGLDTLIDRVPAWKHQYHDFKLHPSVKNAYHALSIDDDRKWFFPTVWKEYDASKQKVEQVWFGGAHTDVGGGFWEAGFSDLALEWMMQKALEHGIKFHLDARRYWNFCVAPDATDIIHPPRSGWGRIYAPGVRNHVWDGEAYDVFGPPRIHESVLERVRQDGTYRPWILQAYPPAFKVEQWFQDTYEAHLQKKYLSESQVKYEAWYMDQYYKKGDKCPSSPHEWRSKLENSFKAWRASHHQESFREWREHNQYSLEEFEGKKILVERIQTIIIKDSVLRDYDRTDLAAKVEHMYFDRSAFDRLGDRAVKQAEKLRLWEKILRKKQKPDQDRIKYDIDRWKPSNETALEEKRE